MKIGDVMVVRLLGLVSFLFGLSFLRGLGAEAMRVGVGGQATKKDCLKEAGGKRDARRGRLCLFTSKTKTSLILYEKC